MKINKEQILRKINKEYTVAPPTLTAKNLKRQYEEQADFLRLIYNLDEKGQDGAFELRPIKRDKFDKTYIKSKHFWSLEESDEKYLRTYLDNLNGHGFCSYYSTYSFDYNMQVEKSRETTVDIDLNEVVKIKHYTKGVINNTNALYTQILPLDIDDVTYDQYLEYKNIFIDLGIETVDVWSGHGVQMLVLLDEKLYNKEIYKHWTTLLISKGIPVDNKIVDPARVLRLPASFNCKALDTYENKDGQRKLKFPELKTIIRNVFLLSKTNKRYNYLDAFSKIRSLPDVVNSEDISKLEKEEQVARQRNLTQTTSIKPQKEVLDFNRTAKELDTEALNTLVRDYSMLPIDELPLAIQNMLQGAPQGLRSRSVLFLAPFLQNYFKLDKKIITEVIQIFEGKCRPATRHFTVGDISRFLAHKPKYTSDLCSQFGYIDFQKIVVVNVDKMKISRHFFYYYNQLSDGAVNLYLKMKLHQEDTKKLSFTVEDIETYLGIKKRTFFKYVTELISLDFINKKRANKKDNGAYIYSLNMFKQSNYITFNKSLLKLLLNETNNGEMKLYTYLKFLSHDENSNTCTMMQTLLGVKINKSQSTIVALINSLDKKTFVKKITIGKGINTTCIYKLLR